MLKKRNRSGQITLFIILGIVLVLAIALIILAIKYTTIFTPKEVVPLQKGSVESYLTTCIEKIGNDALTQIGTTGGYIEVPKELEENSFASLRLAPIEGMVVPYWAYADKTNIPTLDEIKYRVDNYINKELPLCLKELQQTSPPAWVITEKGPVNSDVLFGEEATIFKINYPIELQSLSGQPITQLDSYQVISPARVKKTYETAKSLVEAELRDLKIEKLTIDLISLEHSNLPLAGVELSCDKKKWKVNKVQETLQELLSYNLRQLKIEGTDYVNFPNSLPYYQNHYLWQTGIKKKDIAVTFKYEPTFPFSMAVTPRDGNTMQSGMSQGQKMISELCVQMWKFTYDITYPVLVEVQDEAGHYLFQTAFTVHIIRNYPHRQIAALPPLVQTPTIGEEDKFCAEKKLPINIKTFRVVENKETGIYERTPLGNVNLSFICLKYACPLGTTEYNYELYGDAAIAKPLVPYCPQTLLKGSKSSYKEGKTVFATVTNKEVELNLVPLFEVPANKFKFSKQRLDAAGTVKEKEALDQEDVILLTIKRIEDNQILHESSTTYSSGLDLEDKNGNNIMNENKLAFLAGTTYVYQIESYLMKGGEGDDQKILGGYKGNWTVNWQQLKEMKEIDFNLVYKESGSEEDYFDLILNLEEQSQKIGAPEIKVK
ncbi:hypothetical protein J4417_05845 [Candidatus Woesearchaeota archaeon]|nr:hypothetical protein [Candidatus Woesearchaeota archaeon]